MGRPKIGQMELAHEFLELAHEFFDLAHEHHEGLNIHIMIYRGLGFRNVAYQTQTGSPGPPPTSTL